MSMLGKNLGKLVFPLSEQRISQVFTQNLWGEAGGKAQAVCPNGLGWAVLLSLEGLVS